MCESDYAWHCGNSDDETHEVGRLWANSWGLYDMHGNVNEWCKDHYVKNYEGVPTDGTAWEGGANGTLRDDEEARVDRGGSWGTFPYCCTSADRGFDAPGAVRSTSGFRVAASLE